MTEAETILKMIEELGPDDPDKEDEINARAWCYLNKENYKRHIKKEDKDCPLPLCIEIYTASYQFAPTEIIFFPFVYLSSRDALKSIRPEGWLFQCSEIRGKGFSCIWQETGNKQEFIIAEYLPTEERAELHAIIQATEYDRNHQPKGESK